MAKEIFLQENVLSDNILSVADKGKIFKGGYIAIIKEYVYQNAWQDREIIKMFRKKERLVSYLGKVYPQVDFDFSETCLES